MKINDELVLVVKKNGTYYLRRNRIDNINKELMSPARKEILQRVREISNRAYNKTGLYYVNGRRLPSLPALLASYRGKKAVSEHRDTKELNRQQLMEKFRQSRRVVITFGGIPVKVV